MTRAKKYLIIILFILTAMLCMVGASTWIVTTPKTVTPPWAEGKTPIYVKRTAEKDYSTTGIEVSSAFNDIEFCYADGNVLSAKDRTKITVDSSKAVLDNGDKTNVLNNGDETNNGKGILKVGSTYTVSKIVITIDRNSAFYIAGTYKDNFSTDDPLKTQGIENKNDYIKQNNGTDYEFTQFLYKYKTVYSGTPANKGSTYYTIEDALSNLSGTISVEKGSTSFTALSDTFTGYSNSGRTISSGKTLLIPYSDADGGSTLETVLTGTPKDSYATLIIPHEETRDNDLTVSGGTLNVNALRTAHNGGGISSVAVDNGCLKIEENARMAMTGGVWECLGFAYGQGTINVSGGIVYENFTMIDWKGGSMMLGICDNVFPLNQYSLNSIICKTTFTQTAQLQVKTCVTVSDNAVKKDIHFLSSEDGSFLRINKTTKVTKWVDEETTVEGTKAGRVHFEVDGDLTFANLSLTMRPSDMGLPGSSEITITTSGKQVPLPGNFAISLISGTATIPAGVSLKLLPGAELNIANGAKIEVKGSAYAYGQDNVTFDGVTAWQDGKVIIHYPYTNANTTYRQAISDMGYSNTTPATVFVDGTLQIDENAIVGANFSATQNGGKIIYAGGAKCSGKIEEDYTASGDLGEGLLGSTALYALSHHSQNKPFYATLSAKGQLSTGFGDFVAGNTYTYLDGAWRTPSSYNITYHLNGGKVNGITEDVVTLVVSDGILNGATYNDWWTKTCDNGNSNLKTISRSHYTFGGWYTNPNCEGEPVINADGEFVNNSITVTGGGHIELYAKWTPIEYTFNYVIEGYDGQYTLDTAKYTTWNAEMEAISLEELIPDGLPANLLFVGWYDNAQFDNQIKGLSIEDADKFIVGEGNVVTLYGQINEIVTYTVEYHYEKPKDDGDSYANGLTDYRDEVKYKTGEKVNDTYIGALYTDEAANDNNIERKYYFSGWYDEKGNKVEAGDPIQEAMDADGDKIIILTAKWTKKTELVFKDEDIFNKTVYSKPGVFNFTNADIGYNPDVRDYDVAVPTYFGGWQYKGVDLTNSGETYTVQAEGESMTLETKREMKAVITIILRRTDGRVYHAYDLNFKFSYQEEKNSSSYGSISHGQTINGSSEWHYYVKPNEQKYQIQFKYLRTSFPSDEWVDGAAVSETIATKDVTYTYESKVSLTGKQPPTLQESQTVL